MKPIFIFYIAIAVLFMSCGEENTDSGCNSLLFSSDRQNSYRLDEELMVLKQVVTTDTSFFFLRWFDSDGNQVLFLFDPTTPLFHSAEAEQRYYVTGEVKATCPLNPTIDNYPTEIIEIFDAEKISYCHVESSGKDSRNLLMSQWRFQGFRFDGVLRPPTCEDNFLYIVFTTAQVNPNNPNETRFFAEIYNGIYDCFYIYELLTPTIARIQRSDCLRLDIAITKASEKYGSQMMQGLLDPDAIYLSVSGSQLIISPENMEEDLVFTGL